MDRREYLVLLFGGLANAELDGILAGTILHYPIAWLFWAPGWSMMGIAVFAFNRSLKHDT